MVSKTPKVKRRKARNRKQVTDPLATKKVPTKAESQESTCHLLGSDIVCNTEDRGFAMPGNANPAALAVHVSQGFIPLWEPNQVLRWQFNDHSMEIFESPELAKEYMRDLFGEAVLDWADSAPIRFREVSSGWDFEIYMSRTDDCDSEGRCTTGMAFFPDGGRHRMFFYPRTFKQIRKEQVDTFTHEIGHVFGLRHFFANLEGVPSEEFGDHRPFSIMNYGELSELTPRDTADLALLYDRVWSEQLRKINGTPIRLFRPFHHGSRQASKWIVG